MVKVIDREALKRRKWNAAKIREKARADRKKQMAEIFGSGYEDRRAATIAKIMKG